MTNCEANACLHDQDIMFLVKKKILLIAKKDNEQSPRLNFVIKKRHFSLFNFVIFNCILILIFNVFWHDLSRKEKIKEC